VADRTPFRIKRNLAVIIAVLLALISALLLLAIDSSVQSLLDNIRRIKLQRMSEAQLSVVSHDIRNLKTAIEAAERRVAAAGSRKYPNLQDLKRLSHDHRLTLRRIQRMEGATTAEESRTEYSATFTGTLGNVVRFLKVLEDSVIFDADHVTMEPADEAGDNIALHLSITLTP
jgi:hypothetical protein